MTMVNENYTINTSQTDQENCNKLKTLLSIIEKIFTEQTYTANFQTIYSRSHDICNNLLTQDFYRMLNNLFTKIVESYSMSVQTMSNEDFISFIINTYSFYRDKVMLLSDLLIYMENIRIKFSSSENSITHICMAKFISLALSEGIRDKLLVAICDELKALRDSGYKNTRQFLTMIGLLNDIKLYGVDRVFIDEVLVRINEDSLEYFNASSELLNDASGDVSNVEKSTSDYLKRAAFILDNEREIFTNLEEKDSIIALLVDTLLVAKRDELIMSGLKVYIDSDEKEQIALLFKLFSTFEDSKSYFYSSVQDLIISMLKYKESIFVHKTNSKVKYFNFYQYVDEIYELRKKIMNTLLTACENSTKLEHIIKLNFEKLVNKYECFLENFVKIIHDEIKICIKNKNNAKIKEFTDTFLSIYKLFSDKDVFELEYRKYLEKRLIRNASMLKETEYELYEILKKESGSNHVTKIKTMLDDIENSKYLNDDFRRYCLTLDNKQSTQDIDFIVKILSSDSWPLEGVNYKTKHADTINLPNILDNYITRFTNFYFHKFEKRQIIWVHEFSWAIVNFKAFGGKRYELIVSSYQMTMLDLFNKRKRYSVKDLCALMGIAVNDDIKFNVFISYLIPLLKFNVLVLSDNKPFDKITASDFINLNESFASDDYRINLNFKYETVREEKKEKEISHFIIEDRKYQIDAIIVKLLKQQKKISYEPLKSQVIQAVRSYFIPDSAIIDTRLENLLNRNLIAKDAENINVYVYSI
jgi:cullin-4